MIGFITYLIIVLALGFFVLFVRDVLSKRTIPQADELTTQFNGIAPIETAPLPKRAVANNHWYMHTFERPRRKVK